MNEILVAGEWVACERTVEVRNPYTGDVVGGVGVADADQVRTALRAARAYRPRFTAFDRSEILTEAAARVEADADGFAESICGESGLARKDADREVGRALALLRLCAEEAKRISGEAIPTDVTAARHRRTAVTRRDPVGVVAAITPFNRPLHQVVNKVGPAIAAGNRVVLKPSEKTPLTAIRFVRCLLDAGLPAPMLTLLTGTPEETGQALITSDLIDMVTFTGSADVGRHIASTIGMCRSTYELGDSGALIVLDDADLPAAARAAAAGAFATSGQSCRGVKRILVHEDVAGEFVELLREQAAALVVGDPRDPGTDVGTLIDEAAALAVEGRVQEAVRSGARLVHGGHREGAQFWPTVLDEVPRHVRLVREETFGPCAPVIRVSGLDEAIAITNGTRYGLQTGLFTERLSAVRQAMDELEVGAVIVNDGPQFDSPNIPFGGVKDSGVGREGVRFAIHEMTTVRTLVL
ncbi:aldehyde dehydrogenase family protein [Streptomyces phyllanthi]|uniref:Aldehyde dehydrogenase family protein n=1 Tax=Streptomyces phyllanthi TaxID=1803180 RepID=A0A5N8VV03_9ACTN|nr:aldehyde dehydrogenase family protein [Streptomyces phyllanthi]MPY38602.1 aldehyde dehydrogenase family protein [Streptomyces phyllanthi]